METNLHLKNELPLKLTTTSLNHRLQNFSKTSGYKIFVFKSTDQIVKKMKFIIQKIKILKLIQKNRDPLQGLIIMLKQILRNSFEVRI